MRTCLLPLLAAVLSCSQPPPPASPSPPPSPSPAASPSPSPSPSPPPAASPSPPPPAADRAWIERSNQNAQLLLQLQAEFQPEGAAALGIPGLDDRISDFTPGYRQRQRDAIRKVSDELERRLAAESHPLVAQDLQILIAATRRQIKGSELSEKLEVQYLNVPRLVFGSMRALLEPQVAKERHPAALVRLRKYLGMEGGKPSVVQLAKAEIRAGLKNKLLAPPRLELENDLQTAAPLIDGVAELFKEFQIAGADAAIAEMRKQLTDYLGFVRKELLPRARNDFRLPPELYAFALEQVGVDIPPAELAARARKAFAELQAEMQTIATKIAAQRGLPSSDYRDVIKELKKQQIPDDQILDFYKKRLVEVEGSIRAQRLVTLPDRPARIRLGTPAENAQSPAPHMVPPRLIGNTGEQGEFVLPLAVPGKTAQKYDDFNFDAATWTLIAHEVRPGHEMQFSRMVEIGVSLTRAIFAFNSVNVEGWGLYAEAIALPFMPLEGQLISLQLRLQRAARAFVDPELQVPGKWTPESARAFLQKEVGISPAFATSEVDRYTFRSPGQATAYFYGYTKLLELRKAAEAQLGNRFDQRAFHDLVLAQGMLPPDLLRKAVLAELR